MSKFTAIISIITGAALTVGLGACQMPTAAQADAASTVRATIIQRIKHLGPQATADLTQP